MSYILSFFFKSFVKPSYLPPLTFDPRRYCDILCPNQTELSLLSSLPATTVAECESAAREVMKAAQSLGGAIQSIIVTLGADGCLLVSNDSDEVYHCPSTKLDGPVIDTVGAGDW